MLQLALCASVSLPFCTSTILFACACVSITFYTFLPTIVHLYVLWYSCPFAVMCVLTDVRLHQVLCVQNGGPTSILGRNSSGGHDVIDSALPRWLAFGGHGPGSCWRARFAIHPVTLAIEARPAGSQSRIATELYLHAYFLSQPYVSLYIRQPAC